MLWLILTTSCHQTVIHIFGLPSPSSDDFPPENTTQKHRQSSVCTLDHFLTLRDLTFLVKGQRFPQKEILRGECGAGLEEATQKSDDVQIEVIKGQRGAIKGIE